MNIGVNSSGVTYKKIDTEACGSLTCFKYQITDSASPGSTQYAWFDNGAYLLREWKSSDSSGSSTDMTISYQAISITAPSPVQDYSAATGL
jgi:outer membrane lipoprotein-sorting protein